MKLVADNSSCQLCDRPAIIELRDQIQAIDVLFCQVHKPDLWLGKSPHLTIRRFRSEPESMTCRLMEIPEESPEHTSFHEEMCDLLILGGEGASSTFAPIDVPDRSHCRDSVRPTPGRPSRT
jgi:hypothetical protein